jgi:hypothetical protein
MIATEHDYSPLLLFVVTLVIGLALLYWMIKVTLQCNEH